MDFTEAYAKFVLDADNSKSRRLFFEMFAEKRKFNPSIADNWYSVTWRDIAESVFSPRILPII